MPRYIRSQAEGATFFFTLTLHDRSARYLVDRVSDLRTCMAEVRGIRPFNIDAIVVLPEHMHAIWTLPEGDKDYATRWMLLKQSFTRRLQCNGVLDASASGAHRRKGERSLWQHRFWEHQIRDPEDLSRHIDYIHFNPVKHGWVLRARDWPYSSLHRYTREGKVPLDWGISAAIPGQFGD